MTSETPEFALEKNMEAVNMRFNGLSVILYKTDVDPRQIHGWVENPRIEMMLRRWRNSGQMSPDAAPDDDEMLELMLEDDRLARNPSNRTFALEQLGEDIKRNGVREPIIVTWDGKLLDGNRRKFAAMWALSEKGGANKEQTQLLERIPALVLADDANESAQQSILIQENYAESLKKAWPEVVINGALYRKYRELSDYFPAETDLDIRRRLREEFPRFNITEIRDRISTWELTEEFRGDYADELNEDNLERHINDRFQYFRQANDTYRNNSVYSQPEFKEMLFTGIRHDLFPSFASVRTLDDIYKSDAASEIFFEGEGMSPRQKRDNFRRATDEAGRERANELLSPNSRIESFIEFLDNLTSKQLTEIPVEIRERLENALERIIAQSEAADITTDGDEETE